MCESVMRGDPDNQSAEALEAAETLFIEHFLKLFTGMTSDKIVNVRIQLAETLSILYEKHERMERVNSGEETKEGSL